jgi:hypothetical protein
MMVGGTGDLMRVCCQVDEAGDVDGTFRVCSQEK